MTRNARTVPATLSAEAATVQPKAAPPSASTPVLESKSLIMLAQIAQTSTLVMNQEDFGVLSESGGNSSKQEVPVE